MKKLLMILAAVFASVSIFAQGTILFNNRTLTAGDIRVYAFPGGPGVGTLGTVNAQLYLVNGGGATPTYTPLMPATTFRTSPAASFFVNPVDVTTDLPAGTTVNLVMRIWMGGSSFEAAQAGAGLWGESAQFSLRLGGANPATGEIIQTPDLAGNLGNPMQSFFVPEPSTIALGVVGAAALLYRRRALDHLFLTMIENSIAEI